VEEQVETRSVQMIIGSEKPAPAELPPRLFVTPHESEPNPGRSIRMAEIRVKPEYQTGTGIDTTGTGTRSSSRSWLWLAIAIVAVAALVWLFSSAWKTDQRYETGARAPVGQTETTQPGTQPGTQPAPRDNVGG
jgi:hypothetical protein